MFKVDGAEGNFTGGTANQYGAIVDTNPLSGTYHKSILYSNGAILAIIPNNAGSGYFPLQVKTSSTDENRFSVDLEGDVLATGSIGCNSLSVDSNAGSINNVGQISGTGVAIGSGVLECGQIECGQLYSTGGIDTNDGYIHLGSGNFQTTGTVTTGHIIGGSSTITTSGRITGGSFVGTATIDIGSGDLECGQIECGQIDSTGGISTNNGAIVAGSGPLGCGAIGCDVISCSAIRFPQNGRILFASGVPGTTIVGAATNKTLCSHLDFTGTGNVFDATRYGLPKGVYLNDGVYRLVINPGDYRTNDDKTVPIQIHVIDSTQGDRSRAKVSSGASEMIAIISVPQGWTANAVQVNSSYPMNLEVFKTRNDGTGGVAADRLIAGSVTTNGLRVFDSAKEHDGDFRCNVMVRVVVTDATHDVAGGFLRIVAASGL